jgi:hypothetical protein
MADSIAKEGVVPDIAVCFLETKEDGVLAMKRRWTEEEHPVGFSRGRTFDGLHSRGLLNMNV